MSDTKTTAKVVKSEAEANDLFHTAFAADPFNVRADNMMKVLKHMSTYEPLTTNHFTVTYDPKQISYGKILQIFFSVVHDPTQLNRQGPDTGTQYRSAIFTANDEQKKVAEAYIAQLNAAKVYGKPIVTKVSSLQAFFPAEAYHQDYLTLHPNQPYIAFNDLPKVENLKKLFADNYIEKPTLVRAVTN